MDRLLSAPEPLLQSVLIALCDDARTQSRALKYLGQLQDYAAVLESSKSAAESAAPSKNPLKRKAPAPPLQICIQCKRAFAPAENTPEVCLHHDGDLVIDDDHEVWADWDEDVGGPHDTAENQEDHPEGYVWTCCDKDGTRSGCAKGYHQVVRQNHFKRSQACSSLGRGSETSRVFEGRILRANEFVNESLWIDDGDDDDNDRGGGGIGDNVGGEAMSLDGPPSECTERDSGGEEEEDRPLPDPLSRSTVQGL